MVETHDPDHALLEAGWQAASTAPRDGTPVILWIEDEHAPPSYPVTVGVWVADEIWKQSHWRVIAQEFATTIHFDRHIRGWMPLPKPATGEKGPM